MQISENLKKNLQKILIEDEIEAISVVNPKNFEKNIKNFEKILEENRLKYAIHSVLKVNHSDTLLKAGLKNNLRADVSSLKELEQALKIGFTSENITANGPKNSKFLQKCFDENILIVVDSIQELEKVADYSEKNQKKTKILLRLGAFKNASDTRFGIAKWLWKQAIDIVQNHKNSLKVLGFHFHIDIPDVPTRIAIFWEAIEFYKMLLKIGITTKIINFGGSYGTFYQNDISHNLTNPNEKLASNHKMYSVHEYFWVNFLNEVLTRESRDGKPPIATFLRENDIIIWLEPGRSLFSDNAGFVATSVIGTREDSLILNTHSFSLGMREEELPTNPILVGDADSQKKFPYWILGNLCLESDIVYSRAIPFAREIVENDILIFPNMAAYHMDFYETESILHPKKVKFFIDENDNLHRDE